MLLLLPYIFYDIRGYMLYSIYYLFIYQIIHKHSNHQDSFSLNLTLCTLTNAFHSHLSSDIIQVISF